MRLYGQILPQSEGSVSLKVEIPVFNAECIVLEILTVLTHCFFFFPLAKLLLFI